MLIKTVNIEADYKRAQLPAGTPEGFCPKRDGFQPTLDCLLHADAQLTEFSVRKRPAVIVIPGGAYRFASQREGEPVAAEFFGAGFQSFVLWYSVKPSVFPAALMELALAVKYVRDHAAEFNIDPQKIAVCGFSAGGHLAGSLSTMWHEDFLTESLGVSKEDIRPDASVLCYPVISSGPKAHVRSIDNLADGLPEEMRDYLSLEKRVSGLTPKTFLWTTWTDQIVPVQNTILYAEALADAGVPAEVHIFRTGRHGLSLATEFTAHDPRDILDDGTPNSYIVPHVEQWIGLARDFLRRL